MDNFEEEMYSEEGGKEEEAKDKKEVEDDEVQEDDEVVEVMEHETTPYYNLRSSVYLMFKWHISKAVEKRKNPININ